MNDQLCDEMVKKAKLWPNPSEVWMAVLAMDERIHALEAQVAQLEKENDDYARERGTLKARIERLVSGYD